jgi:hypothetical protein
VQSLQSARSEKNEEGFHGMKSKMKLGAEEHNIAHYISKLNESNNSSGRKITKKQVYRTPDDMFLDRWRLKQWSKRNNPTIQSF